MADEVTNATQEPTGTAEVETEQKANPAEQVTEQPADEAAERDDSQPESPGEDSSSDLWRQVAPELADHVNDLAPEAREGILLRKLAAQAAERTRDPDSPQGGPPNAIHRVGDPGAGPKDKSAGGRPPVLEIPELNVDRMKVQLTEAFGADAAEAVAKSLAPTLDYVQKLAQAAHAAIQENTGQLRELTVPQELERALPKVPGATRGDIAAARAILDEGTATTYEAALSLAAFNRQAQMRRPISDDARRRAASIAASSHASPQHRVSEAPIAIPMGVEGYRELYRRQALAQRAAGRKK